MRLLADLLLHCRWTVEDHQGLGIAYTKKHPTRAKAFIQTIHSTFPYVPSRRQLIAFLSGSRGLLDGMRWKRLPDIYWKRQLVPSVMQPAIAACQQFEVPAVNSEGALAHQLFNLPSSVLEWLSDERAQHYLVKAIAKRGSVRGKLPRIIEQPKRLLKAAQRDIVREILQWVPVHPAAHGFVRGRSVTSFTSEHVQQSAVLRMDIESFFPSIRAPRVSAVFRSLGYPRSVVRVLTNLCTTSSRLDGQVFLADLPYEQQAKLVALYGHTHLPQGAPTSPSLANLVAYRLDARLLGLAEKARCHYSRYADDLLFSGDRRWQRQAEQFANQVAAIAMDEGFQINHRKTRLMPQAARQVATGIVINRHTNIERRQFDNLKATLNNCVRSGPASQNRDQHANFRAHLLGRIGWVEQLNPARAAKLRRIFNRIEWQNDLTKK